METLPTLVVAPLLPPVATINSFPSTLTLAPLIENRSAVKVFPATGNDTLDLMTPGEAASSEIMPSGLTVAELPENRVIKKELSRWKALWLGSALGTISGMVLAVPATLLEKVFKTPDITTATIDSAKDFYGALQDFVDLAHQKGLLQANLQKAITKELTEASERLEVANNPQKAAEVIDSIPYPSIKKWANSLLTCMKILKSTPALSIMLGVGLGAAVGLMVVGEVKKRLLEIKDTDKQIKEGTFKPKKPTLMQRFGIDEKSVENPQVDLDQLLQEKLNPKGAFWMGVKSVLVLKFLKATVSSIPSVIPFICTPRGRKFLWSSIKPLLTPLAIFKFMTLPIIGGLLAMKLVPWMRQKLQLGEPPESGISQPMVSAPALQNTLAVN